MRTTIQLANVTVPLPLAPIVGKLLAALDSSGFSLPTDPADAARVLQVSLYWMHGGGGAAAYADAPIDLEVVSANLDAAFELVGRDLQRLRNAGAETKPALTPPQRPSRVDYVAAPAAESPVVWSYKKISRIWLEWAVDGVIGTYGINYLGQLNNDLYDEAHRVVFLSKWGADHGLRRLEGTNRNFYAIQEHDKAFYKSDPDGTLANYIASLFYVKNSTQLRRSYIVNSVLADVPVLGKVTRHTVYGVLGRMEDAGIVQDVVDTKHPHTRKRLISIHLDRLKSANGLRPRRAICNAVPAGSKIGDAAGQTSPANPEGTGNKADDGPKSATKRHQGKQQGSARSSR